MTYVYLPSLIDRHLDRASVIPGCALQIEWEERAFALIFAVRASCATCGKYGEIEITHRDQIEMAHETLKIRCVGADPDARLGAPQPRLDAPGSR